MIRAFALFHLNLAYSSLAADRHSQVIDRCYQPLLDLIVNQSIPLGIELSGWTLQRIQEVRPDWIKQFRSLLKAQRCELIGSGQIQLIGPLVPPEVNSWNQFLGMQTYRRILGITPEVALVNEMAFSSGLIEIYRQAGYRALVMDRDNVCLALGLAAGGLGQMPLLAEGGPGNVLPVLWSDSIFFQRMQRFAHGDITSSEYLDYFRQRAALETLPLPLYSNDAEVFDFRPGRFAVESDPHPEGEWQRIFRLFKMLKEEEGIEWISPSAALKICQDLHGSRLPRRLTSTRQPIPVKKQAKYNISRWAVSGRDDLYLNTLCHRIYQGLMKSKSRDPELWERLCRLWASDLRTHIRPERWEEACAELSSLCAILRLPLDYDAKPAADDRPLTLLEEFQSRAFTIQGDPERIYLTIASENLRLVLNLRRGLTIQSLAFKCHDFVPMVGTIPHGYFNSIELGADFYSAGVVMEQVTEHRRITDLEWVTPRIQEECGLLRVRAEIETECGVIVKEVTMTEKEEISFSVAFPGWERGLGTLRAGTLTLLPQNLEGPVYVETSNGGKLSEKFTLCCDALHTRPASTLVSSTTGLGGSSGSLLIGDQRRRLSVSWNPSLCAAFPMLHHQNCPPAALTRITFSLLELDETSRPGGTFPPFQFVLRPA